MEKQKGDFIVDHAYTFEVGGADKTFKQIADLPIPSSWLTIWSSPPARNYRCGSWD